MHEAIVLWNRWCVEHSTLVPFEEWCGFTHPVSHIRTIMDLKASILVRLPVGLGEVDARVLLRDALSSFLSVRQDVQAYVDRGYSFRSLEARLQKTEEVMARCAHASALQELI